MTKAIQMSLYGDADIEKHCQAGWFSGALTALKIIEGNQWPDQFGDALRHWNSSKSQPKVTAISLLVVAADWILVFMMQDFNW
jgi:hypothetical protein